tara:strand:- start:10561 stop:10902 length:342 start_codon:yes stop_codon:yes gene_type:complete
VAITDMVEKKLQNRPAKEIVISNKPDEDINIGYKGLSFIVEKQLEEYFRAHGADLPPPNLYARILKEIERPLFKLALIATDGNQVKAATLLGLNRNTLRKKLNEHKIRIFRKK